MARPKRFDTGSWTPSQVVAHNLTRARQLRGLTQAEIAERLSHFTGTPWSAVTVAQAEGSVTGQRVRQFTANELVALAQTFDLPVLYFFLPPEDRSGELRTPNGDLPWEYLLMVVWGHRRNFADVAARAAPWAHASTVLVPYDDYVNPAEEPFDARAGSRHRDRLTP
jgi:transcriptional regulator with XRE-family HTH domain